MSEPTVPWTPRPSAELSEVDQIAVMELTLDLDAQIEKEVQEERLKAALDRLEKDSSAYRAKRLAEARGIRPWTQKNTAVALAAALVVVIAMLLLADVAGGWSQPEKHAVLVCTKARTESGGMTRICTDEPRLVKHQRPSPPKHQSR
jgi:hypothetical protein